LENTATAVAEVKTVAAVTAVAEAEASAAAKSLPDVPKAMVVLRTEIAQLPVIGDELGKRVFSRILVVPTKHATLACATDRCCIAVVEVQGEAKQQTAINLEVLQATSIRLPILAERDGDTTKVSYVVDVDDKLTRINPVFQVADDSSEEKFPNTEGVIETAEGEDWIVVSFDAERMLKLAMALNEDHGNPFIHLIVPRDGDLTKIRAEGHHGIGVLCSLDSGEEDKSSQIIQRFNRLATSFNEARAKGKTAK